MGFPRVIAMTYQRDMTTGCYRPVVQETPHSPLDKPCDLGPNACHITTGQLPTKQKFVYRLGEGDVCTLTCVLDGLTLLPLVPLHFCIEKERRPVRERERERERQTDRQTETDRQRQEGVTRKTQRERQTDKLSERERDKQTD